VRRQNSRHGYSRRYIMDAILKALSNGEWMYARDLVEDVSKLSGRPVSSLSIGQHMLILEDEGKVRRMGTRSKRVWRKTWRGGVTSSKVLNTTSVIEVDDPK